MTSSPGTEIIDARTGFGDDAREVAALTGRERGGEYVLQQTLADGRLTGVHSRCFDLDENLARCRCGPLDIADVEHVDIPVLIKSHCSAHDSYERLCSRAIPRG
jgi:hypothetical protein